MLWEKEKLLIKSNFSFLHSLFKRLLLQTSKTKGLFGKGLKVHPLLVCSQFVTNYHLYFIMLLSLLYLHAICNTLQITDCDRQKMHSMLWQPSKMTSLSFLTANRQIPEINLLHSMNMYW